MSDKYKQLDNDTFWLQTQDVKSLSFATNVLCNHCKLMCIEYTDNETVRMKYPDVCIDSFIRDVKEDSPNVQIRRHDIN
jgi:hypothetical protein